MEKINSKYKEAESAEEILKKVKRRRRLRKKIITLIISLLLALASYLCANYLGYVPGIFKDEDFKMELIEQIDSTFEDDDISDNNFVEGVSNEKCE